MNKKSKDKRVKSAKSNSRPGKSSGGVTPVHFAKVASSIIWNKIDNKQLELVSLDAPNIKVCGPHGVDFYVVHWQEWPSVFSFSQLKKGKIHFLAKKWTELKEEYDQPVLVHFVSNDLPATTKLKGTPDDSYHFANFVTNEWKRAPVKDEFGDWQSIWSQLQKASRLDDDDLFREFVLQCQFQFNYRLKELELANDEEKKQFEKVCRFVLTETEDDVRTFALKDLTDFLSAEEEPERESEAEAEEEPEREPESEPEEEPERESESEPERESESESESEPESESEAESEPEAEAEPGPKENALPDDPDDDESSKTLDKQDLDSLNRSYESKEIEIEYRVNEEESSLDFAPDVKSVQDVREKGTKIALSTDNFQKIIQLNQKQTGLDKETLQALEDSFDWYFNNANELYENGQLEEAEQDYRNALEKLVQLDTPKPEEETKLLENLGEIYISLERADLAVELYEHTEEMRVSTTIPIPKYINALLITGGTYEERGYLKDAEPVYRKAIEIAGNYLEMNDPLLKRANEALLRLTKEKTNLISRFSPRELDKLKADDESNKPIIHRKPTIENKVVATGKADNIWITKEELNKPPLPKQYSNLKWWLLSLIPISVLCFGLVFHFPDLQKLSTASESTFSTFTSLDERNKVVLKENGVILFSRDGASIEGSYKFVNNGIQDFISLLPGHLRRTNRFWRHENEDVVSFEGTKYYARDAHELALTKYMWRYSKLAQLYRNENRKYPDAAHAFKNSRVLSTYVNPFTKIKGRAEIVYELGSSDGGLPKKVGSGVTWKGQSTAMPGLITCNNFEGSRFFIRAYDRDGKFLTSSQPGTCFFIELSYGDNVTSDKLKEIQRNAPHTTEKKNIRYVFVKGAPALGKYFSIVDALIPTFLAIGAILTAMFWRRKSKEGEAAGLHVAGFICSITLLIIWYLIAFADI